MVPFRGGMLTSFNDDDSVYFSPDGQNLCGGGNTVSYGGNVRARHNPTDPVVRIHTVIPYDQGVFSLIDKSPGTRVRYSPDGRNLVGGGNTIVVYDGQADVTAMLVHRGGVLTAFMGLVGKWKGFGVYFSPDGLNLDGGGATRLVYSGLGIVSKFLEHRTATNSKRVIAEFVGTHFTGRDPKPWGIHSSSIADYALIRTGVTAKVYDGKGRVAHMIPYLNGVITAFENASQDRSWSTYYSRDGFGIGGGHNTIRVYTQP
jgi:hypothetical protein